MICDLHIHTTCSDGVLRPCEAAAMAKENGVDCMAVCDHDTMAGVEEAARACAESGIRLISGAELSTGPDGETHVLCYGASPEAPPLQAFFRSLQEDRADRARKMLRRLRALGFPLDDDRIIAEAGPSIGRPHIARALVAKGWCRTVPEAFDRFLGVRRPAYVPRRENRTGDVISLILSAGGLPVLAHPHLMHVPREILCAYLREWKDRGLAGMEVYHPCQRGNYAYYASIADSFDLLITGGSDFHAPDTANGPIGGTGADWVTCEDDLGRLLSLIPDPTQQQQPGVHFS